MTIALHLITYVSIIVFVVAVAVRFRRIQHYPLHLRWEIYPVPHEGKRAEHGGSRLEETDWWTKPQKPSKWTELKFMIPEMVFIKALFENNRKLWYRSFPFHFGLYLMAGFAGLLALGVVLELAGVPFDASSAPATELLKGATTVIGVAGLVLGILGAVGLLIMRFSDEDLKPYTNFSHIFNLLFIMAGLGLMFSAWLTVDRDFSLMRGYLASLITFNVAAPTGSALVSAACLTLSLMVAYIPLTHMSHFFVKWFTWHKIRWDDEPNVKGGRIEVLIQDALQRPVSWSADHVGADGKKTWADIATEEVEK
jgi:nitrate reductase gamma subunit